LIVTVTTVTPLGTLRRGVDVPRLSSGPDLQHVILGSEGILGVITEAIVKIRRLPDVCKYGAIAFPTFEAGVKCLRDVAYNHCAPASIRLVDPQQFQFGQALRPATEGFLAILGEQFKKLMVTKWYGFDLEQLCAATLVFEGSKEVVAHQERMVYSIAKKYGGLKADENSGKRGYFLTYMIAYMRDLGFQFGYMGESFETSIPWSKTLHLCTRVKDKLQEACRQKGIPGNPLCTCRVTQSYDTGSCVYFYFGFSFDGISNPVEKFFDIETICRDEIIKCGGSISHHHGVGKIRKKWLTHSISPTGIQVLTGIKQTFDPQNIFANGNLIDLPEKEKEQKEKPN